MKLVRLWRVSPPGRLLSMTIRDLFNDREGTAALVVRNGSAVLTLNGGGAVSLSEAWFLRIVEATVEQRRSDRRDRILI